MVHYPLSVIILFISICLYLNQCQDSDAIYAFTEFIREKKKKIMILGPGCSKSTEPLAKVAPYYNLVHVSTKHISVHRVYFCPVKKLKTSILQLQHQRSSPVCLICHSLIARQYVLQVMCWRIFKSILRSFGSIALRFFTAHYFTRD